MLGYNQSYIWHTPRQKHPSSSTKQHPSTFPRLSVLSTTSQEGGLGGGLEPEHRRLRGRVLPQPLDRPCKATQHRPQNPQIQILLAFLHRSDERNAQLASPKGAEGQKRRGVIVPMSGQESNIRPLNPLSTASGVASVCLETVATRATNRFAPATTTEPPDQRGGSGKPKRHG